jgi:hypothetical protein
MSFEAYKVAVRMSLINNVSTGLLAISSQLNRVNRDFTGATASATLLEKRLLSIKRLGLIGGGMAMVGFGGLALMKGPLDAARQYELAYTRFKTLNLGDAINRQANSFARGTEVFGASSKDLMEATRELYGVFGNMESAMKVAPKLVELNAANATLFGGKIGQLDDKAVEAIKRFNDMRGLTDSPEDFMRGLNLVQKMVTGSGGATKFSDVYQLGKTGLTAIKGMSDDGIAMMATVMQEMGGSSAGTALMSAYQNLAGGKTTKRAMAKMQDLGIAELGYVNHGMMDGKAYKSLQIKNIQNRDLLLENFPLWVMKTVIPALEKKGITDLSQQAAAVNDILSNRKASNLGVAFTTQSLQTWRDFMLVKNAMGVDETIQASKDTLGGKEGDLRKKWEDTLLALGDSILPYAVKAVEGMTSAIKGFTAFARENPATVQALTVAFSGLAVALAGFGTLSLVAAGFNAINLAGATLVGAGGLLGAVATGIGLLTKAAGLFVAGFVGWKLGEYIGENHLDDEQKHVIGETVARVLAAFGNDEAQAALKANGAKPLIRRKSDLDQTDHVPTSSGDTRTINNTIVMPNGDVLARVVTREQEKQLSRPPAGGRGFDGSMNLRPVGASGDW